MMRISVLTTVLLVCCGIAACSKVDNGFDEVSLRCGAFPGGNNLLLYPTIDSSNRPIKTVSATAVLDSRLTNLETTELGCAIVPEKLADYEKVIISVEDEGGDLHAGSFDARFRNYAPVFLKAVERSDLALSCPSINRVSDSIELNIVGSAKERLEYLYLNHGFLAESSSYLELAGTVSDNALTIYLDEIADTETEFKLEVLDLAAMARNQEPQSLICPIVIDKTPPTLTLNFSNSDPVGDTILSGEKIIIQADESSSIFYCWSESGSCENFIPFNGSIFCTHWW